MLTHCGTQTLETPRLLLRRYAPEDATKIFENWAGCPAVTDRLDWTAHEDVQVTQRLVDMWAEAYDSSTVYRWCITLNGEPVGDIAVTRWSESDEWCELGYCLTERLWNRGLMSEALSAVTEYLLHQVGFYRVGLKHDSLNPASGRVMQKCGFTFEGMLRGQKKRRDGSHADICYYSRLCDEDADGSGDEETIGNHAF